MQGTENRKVINNSELADIIFFLISKYKYT